MRGWATGTIVLLLLVPTSGSLWHVPVAIATDLPADLSDGDLMRILATKAGHHLTPTPRTIVPTGTTLPGMITHLATRMGKTLTPNDIAAFTQLDPRVAGPTLLLLTAVDQAWTQREAAFAKLTPTEQMELAQLLMARGAHEPTAREQELSANVDLTALINTAIALDDTLEGVVMPQLKQAVQAGAWPPIAIADPVGVLRLGSPGNDVETVDRIVQIDPSGDDTYYNNAGGTTLLSGSLTHPGLLPIALSIDMGGNDTYSNANSPQGGGALGIGLLLDYAGNDRYYCGVRCQGGGADGVGLLRDYAGDDTFWSGQSSLGGAFNGVGIARDDAGNDSYTTDGGSGGYAWSAGGPAGTLKGSIGLLWDRGGFDSYSDRFWEHASGVYGWSKGDSLGLMVDAGPEVDSYVIASALNSPHGCNNCTWTIVESAGALTHRQTGNDGQGGLAAILAANGP